jgi:hypothetical protein
MSRWLYQDGQGLIPALARARRRAERRPHRSRCDRLGLASVSFNAAVLISCPFRGISEGASTVSPWRPSAPGSQSPVLRRRSPSFFDGLSGALPAVLHRNHCRVSRPGCPSGPHRGAGFLVIRGATASAGIQVPLRLLPRFYRPAAELAGNNPARNVRCAAARRTTAYDRPSRRLPSRKRCWRRSRHHRSRP